MKPKPSRRLAAAFACVVLAAAVLRAWSFGQVGGSFIPPGEQEEGYYEQGVSLLSRGLFSLGLSDARPRAWRGPVFPAFAALSEVPFSEPTPGHLRLAQHALSVLGVAFAFWLGLLAAGPAAAFAGAALFALDPGQVLSSNSLNIHAFYGLALLALAGAAALWVEKPDRDRGLLLGAAFGATLLARSTHFLTVPAILALGSWDAKTLKTAARRLAWPAAGLALALLPWTVRNAVQFGRFQPLDSYSGAVNFYAASLGELGSFEIEAAVARAEPESPGISALYARDRDGAFPILLGLASKRVRAEPLAYARSTAARARLLYGPWWPALLLAAAGLWFFRRSRAAWAVGAVGASLGTYALVAVQPGYADAARPLLAVLCGWGLAGLVGLAARGRPAAAPAVPRAATAGAWAFAAVFAANLVFADALVLREPFLARAPAPGKEALPPRLRDGRAAALTVLYARRSPRAAADLERGVVLLDSGRGEEACAAFEKAWRGGKGASEAGLRAADCRAASGRAAEAEAVARVLVKAAAGRPLDESRARGARAKALVLLGRKDEAAREWRAAGSPAGADPAVRRAAAEGLLALGRAKDALAVADAIVASNETNLPSARAAGVALRGRALLALGRKEEAAAAFKSAAVGSEDVELKRGAAEGLLAAGRAGEALALAEEVVATDGAASEAVRASDLTLRARVLLALGRREAALADLRRGAMRGAAGRPAVAAAARAALAAAVPDEARGFVDLLLSAAAENGDDPAAAAAWDSITEWLKAVREKRGDADVRAELDRALAGALAGAAPGLRASALISRASSRWAAGDAGGGNADLEAALSADAGSACRRAPDLVDPGRLPLNYFAACLKRFPGDAGLLADQGVALFRDGRGAESAASLRAALDAEPGRLEAALSLQAVLGTKDAAESRRRLGAALAASKEPAKSPLRDRAKEVLAGAR